MMDMNMNRVDDYLGELERTVESLRDSLNEIGRKTIERKFDELQRLVDQMPTVLASLESMLDRRGKLLVELTTGDHRPRSLRAYLRSTGDAERLEWAESLADQIERQRRRAVTIFTTHYWLFETTREVMRILTTRGPSPKTYGPQSRTLGGGLLDEAA